MRTLARAAAVAAALSMPAVASAQVIFNNGTPDNRSGVTITNGITAANDFTLSSSETLASFDFWVLYDGTSGPATTSASFFWQVLSDLSGGPGNVLASGTATSTGTRTAYTCCSGTPAFQAYAFNASLGNTVLGAGTYWLTVGGFTADDNSTHYWSTSNPSSGNEYYQLNGTWHEIGVDGAFAINGPVTATPEPASLALLGTGMLGLGGIGVSRRKRQAKDASARHA